jgi:hypothetical protein
MKVITILCCITLSLMSLHQANAAIVQGTVKVKGVLLDPQDARVVDATVTFWNEKLNRKAYLSEEGIFEISLPAGLYQFSVQSGGFRAFKIESLEIKADGVKEMKVHLELEPIKGPHSIGGVFERIEPEKAPLGEKIKPRKIS